MSASADDAGGVAVARLEEPPVAPVSRERYQSGSSSVVPRASVYLEAARAMLPRWLRILGPTPWFLDDMRDRTASRRCASLLHRRQAAALAVGLLCELDPRRADRSCLQEYVRVSLLRWQLCLRGDGRPANRRLRASPLHGVIAHRVVQLLSETTPFQTAELLGDLERHLHWLARRRAQSPWLEAATICALADGALLVRRADMLRQARTRLEALLARQDREGWFAERGGADVGRLSLTLDALARLYRHNGWEELEDPLRRMLSFLIHFVHPDDSVGGCCGSCETAFLSPVGVELLAAKFDDAAALALVCRRHWVDARAQGFERFTDELCATLGASLTLAGVNPAVRLPEGCDYPYEHDGTKRFPRAGLFVFSTPAYYAVLAGKKGGTVRVTWKGGAGALDDAGITVVYSHGARTSAGFDQSTGVCADGRSVTCEGILRRAGAASGRKRSRIKRAVRRLLRTARLNRPTRANRRGNHIHSPSARRRRLAHDYFTRRITFGADWIRICDRVSCRLPCQTIVCQSAAPTRVKPLGEPGAGCSSLRAPIFINGGRQVEITRVYRNGRLIDHTQPAS